jgi:hypothetical protein
MPKRFFKDSSREALLTKLIIASCARAASGQADTQCAATANRGEGE